MNTLKSNEFLGSLQQQLKAERDKLQSWIDTVPVEILQQSAAPGSWSAIQCFEHLNSYGRYYLPLLQTSVNDYQGIPGEHTYYKPSMIGAWFKKLMEPKADGTISSKMKAPKDHRPDASLNAEEVLKEFDQQLLEMITCLYLAENINIQKIKVPISISKFIKLSLGDTFGFMVAHIRRHMLQAEKAIAAAQTYENGSR